MKELNILLIGQPNVGKSTLLNSISGSRLKVSNYPGTTVELTKAVKKFKGSKIEFTDTPGIYSISDRSEEEKVTEKALFENEIDGAIVVADATSLERSLYMILQILEAGTPIVIALNFVEDAKKRGISINTERLEKFLNVPVVPVNPLTGKGKEKLLDFTLEINEISGPIYEVRYDDHIEQAISKISSQVIGDLANRFASIRVLEGDEDFYKSIENPGVIDEIKENLDEHPEIGKDISVTRYGTASYIAEKVTEIRRVQEVQEFDQKIDNVLLNNTWGPISTGLSILIIFGLLLVIGSYTQNFLMDLTDSFLSYLSWDGKLLFVVIKQGLTGLMAGISIALPYIFLFYLFLGVLEDTGILPRFITNSSKFLKKINLPGKSFIPLMLGLGCTAPATRSTRILSNKREQFRVVTLFSFMPCSSRIAIIMGIIGHYGGVWLALSVFCTLFLAGSIWASVMKKVSSFDYEPLLLELPPYRKPSLGNVLNKSWIRMKDFVYVVIPLLAIFGMLYGVLKTLGFIYLVVDPFYPLTTWLGLPAIVIIPILFSFLQKDLAGAMLVSVLGSNISATLTPLQIYTFGVATTIGIPCIIATGMIWKEFSLRKSVILTLVSIGYGLLIAGLVHKIIFLF